MSTPTFNTRDTLTGKLQRLTERQIRPFKDRLEIVADDAKPFEPGLFKPGVVGEFDNPQPAPDAVAEAQANLDALLVDHGPNSNVVKDARAALKAAQDEADAKADAAAKATEQVQAGEHVTAIEGQPAADAPTPQGDAQ